MNMQTKNLRFDLTIEETNLVLEALGHLPFVRVFGLIAKLQDVARDQVGGDARATGVEDVINRTNGATHAEASLA